MYYCPAPYSPFSTCSAIMDGTPGAFLICCVSRGHWRDTPRRRRELLFLVWWAVLLFIALTVWSYSGADGWVHLMDPCRRCPLKMWSPLIISQLWLGPRPYCYSPPFADTTHFRPLTPSLAPSAPQSVSSCCPVTANQLLPGHPVNLSINQGAVTTLSPVRSEPQPCGLTSKFVRPWVLSLSPRLPFSILLHSLVNLY